MPAAVSPEQAAAAMLQGMTAHYLVNSTYAVQAGDEVLVHAAAGGVGQLLVQLAKAKGAHVIAHGRQRGEGSRPRGPRAPTSSSATTRSTTSRPPCATRPAAACTSSTTASARRRSTPRWPRCGAAGMLALFGGASGQVPPFDIQRLNSGGSLFLTRPTLAHYTAERDELLWRAAEVLGAIADGALHITVGGRYPLEQAADAYRDLEARRTTGKLLIVP